MLYSETNITESKHDEWNTPEEAKECLDSFCFMLNFHFQGKNCEIELPSRW